MLPRRKPFGLTRTDLLLPAVLVLAGCVEVLVADVNRPVALVSTTLAGGLLVGRRRWPTICAVGSCLAIVVRTRLGVSEEELVVPLALIFTACAVLGRYSRLVPGLVGLTVVNVAVHEVDGLQVPTPGDVLWVLTVTAGPWLGGRLVLTHARNSEELTARAQRLVVEQRQLSERLVADERRRIARELHDIIAHSLSVMVVQAGAAADVVHHDPDTAARALAEIQRAGRSALDETGRLLHLLREEAESELDPQPTIADLPGLIEVFRSAGLDVDLEVDGPTEDLPAGVDLSIYRIVQEGLTNALKHAPHSPVTVKLRRGLGEVDIELRNAHGPGAGQPSDPRPPSGRGLIGMRERLAMFGGNLDAGPTDDGGYRVHAHLPLAAEP